MQLLRPVDDSKHKELAALSAVLAIEISSLSLSAHQGQILSQYWHGCVYFSLVMCSFISYSQEYIFYQIKSEQK